MAVTVLALGEVLWDVFPDGPRFGGAPANFACACAGLGGDKVNVLLASAVGHDELGNQAIKRLSAQGVDTSLIARNDRTTGQVLVSLNAEGQATYQFVTQPAWDEIPQSAHLETVARTADVVHFSTLGQRTATSRETIRKSVAAAKPDCFRVFDLNLRSPHWTAEVVLDGLNLANVLKLNDDELTAIAPLLELTGTIPEQLAAIQAKFDLRLVALTRGADGSLLYAPDCDFIETPAIPVDVTDTVGAGDAFTAALALGLAFKRPLGEISQWASEVAGYVCTQAGGTVRFPNAFQIRDKPTGLLF